MPSLSELQAELAAHDDNIKEIDAILAVMPDSQDAQDMKADVVAQKREIEKKIALLKPQQGNAASPEDKSSDTPDLTTGASKPNASKDGPERVFATNDDVLAKYAADRQFYPATIVSVMGSSTAPIYTVKFKGYPGTETARWWEVKPYNPSASAGQKRKADGSPAVPSPAPASPSIAPPPSGGHSSALSAPANIDAKLAAQVKKEPSKVSDGPTRLDKAPKKIKTNKALDKAKGSWQDWQKKTSGNSKVAKVANKESMFRTGTDHTARVGFTGSGKTMSKDGVRVKHTFDNKDNHY